MPLAKLWPQIKAMGTTQVYLMTAPIHSASLFLNPAQMPSGQKASGQSKRTKQNKTKPVLKKD